MVFIPVPNAIQVNLQFLDEEGDIAENVFGVQKSGSWTVAQMQSMCNAFLNWWHDGDGAGHTYRSHQPAEFTLLGATARELSTQSGPTTQNTTMPADVVGGQAGAALQAGLTFAMTARTGLAGRSYRGRTFICGISEDSLAALGDNQVPSNYATGLVLAFNALITAVPAAVAGCTLVVISRYSGVTSAGRPIPRSTGITTPITQYGYHDLFLDYQRRRAPAHSRHH